MDAHDLAFAGAAVQARMVRDREVGPRDLVEAVLARIERLQPASTVSRRHGERALADADEAQRQVRPSSSSLA